MISHEKRRGVVTVELAGELDQQRAEKTRREIDELLADPTVKLLVLDLSRVEFMDSSGIGMIIGRYKLLSRRGGAVAVRGNQRVNRIMELAGLYQIVEKLA